MAAEGAAVPVMKLSPLVGFVSDPGPGEADDGENAGVGGCCCWARPCEGSDRRSARSSGETRFEARWKTDNGKLRPVIAFPLILK